ncbi:MAG: molybdate ABC transporter permease subunit [Pirellulaceae bacterium]|nr:molybdate ABC transporter permease subunit [Pirellulaceae bacterium]MDP7014757.1 molybdate ABC transporter permease subunit [Pirellulaceae bacterium]
MVSLSAAEWDAIRLSLLVASVGVAVSLPLGVALGWVLARKQFFGKTLVESIVNLPLVLPPVVTGYLLLITLGRRGFLGKYLDEWFGLRFVFDWKGAALAAAVVAFPLMVRAIRVAFTSVDRQLEQAARTLGAGPLDSFFTISLPLARHGIIAGCVLAFARSLGEFGATIMIAGSIPGETRTIPLLIFNQLETPGGIEKSLPVVLFSVGIAAAALMVGEWMDRRSRRYSA